METRRRGSGEPRRRPHSRPGGPRDASRRRSGPSAARRARLAGSSAESRAKGGSARVPRPGSPATSSPRAARGCEVRTPPGTGPRVDDPGRAMDRRTHPHLHQGEQGSSQESASRQDRTRGPGIGAFHAVAAALAHRSHPSKEQWRWVADTRRAERTWAPLSRRGIAADGEESFLAADRDPRARRWRGGVLVPFFVGTAGLGSSPALRTQPPSRPQ